MLYIYIYKTKQKKIQSVYLVSPLSVSLSLSYKFCLSNGIFPISTFKSFTLFLCAITQDQSYLETIVFGMNPIQSPFKEIEGNRRYFRY